MKGRTIFNAGLIVATIAALLALNLAPVSAAPPDNDNFASATFVGGLPFSSVVDVSEATTEPGEPQVCQFINNSTWYAFTPASSGLYSVDLDGSTRSDVAFAVYRAFGPSIFDLSFQTCASFGTSASFNGDAGATYYIQAGATFCAYPPCSGVMQVNLVQIPGPANDNFADAMQITALPFDLIVDITPAGRESGEPHASCDPDFQSKTLWYAYTPDANGSVTASIPIPGWGTMLAAYTGPSLEALSEIGCRSFGGVLGLAVTAGTTYYFQVAGLFGASGALTFHLETTPPPVAGFGFSPSEPSVYDNVQFFDNSFDPGGVGIQSQAWDFGDGGTATGCCLTHRFAADGEYAVRLTVTTFDGRTATATQTVTVRTHDVSITKFQVPNSAKAGQTRAIVVGVRNNRFPETVRVELYRSTPFGFQFVGFQEVFVPVRNSNRTTDIQFSYTFTPDDAAVGSMNFRAVVSLVSARDALPADNEAISLPVRVNR